MSTANYSSSSPQKPEKDNRKLIYSLLIAALLGSWGYIFYDKSKTDDLIKTKDQQYNSLDSSRNQVQKEYEDALYRLDDLSGRNSSLDSLLKTRNKELETVKARINQLVRKQNASSAELAEARQLIQQLNGKIDGYIAEIERLQGENFTLTQEKRTLTSQKEELERNLSTTQTEKKAAEDKVDIASTLHASNFNILAVNEKNSGKEKATSTAKRADKLRISFELDENRVAPSGEKDIFVLVYDPAGTLISEPGLNSGSFTTRQSGEKQYTNRILVNYEQGKSKNINFDLRQTEKYQPGNYKVEVFHNGFKIGESTVSLKKGGLFS
ncbi:MAG: hypothetical protein ACK43L_08535 [Sphingobacteriales bacterium]|jgi:DNA repair exonuclease SbcCD ATPase subunit